MLWAAVFVGAWSGGITEGHKAVLPSAPLQVPAALSSGQRKIADEIISVFENDTPKLQYGYVENLHDGRGYTAGRGGFTTATGDLYSVVQLYCQAAPKNPFDPYLDILKQRAAAGDDSTDGLGDFENLWSACANDPVFCHCQDQLVDKESYEPALAHWTQLGCKTPLALLVLYDTVVEQGDAKDPDGTPSNIERATKMAGGTPATGVDETTWLQDFMDVRREILLHPANERTQEAWADSVTRVDALNGILLDGNTDLEPPVALNVFGEHWMVTEDGGFRTDE